MSVLRPCGTSFGWVGCGLWSGGRGAAKSSARPGEGEELLARACVLTQQTMDGRGDRPGALGLDSAQGHAHVLRLDHHTHSLGVEVLLQPVRDLDGEPFLDLEVRSRANSSTTRASLDRPRMRSRGR